MWPASALVGLIAVIVLVGLLTGAFWIVWGVIESECEQRTEARRQLIEADLDRKQAELRRTVLALADALAEERVAGLDASQQMIAHAYLTTGRVP